MRGTLLVGLLGISGCNQIFGLKATTEQDAALGDVNMPGIDAPVLHGVKLTRFVVDSTGVGTAHATTIDTTMPLPGDPHAKFGALDQPLVDAPYANGVVQIPVTLLGNPWRLAATLDGVVHEFQWNVSDAHVTSAVEYGNPSPPPPLPGSQYTLNLPNGAYDNLIFTTSGVWTETHRIGPGITTSFTFDMAQVNSSSEPMIGPFGQPKNSRGDWQLFVQQDHSAACHPSTGVAFQSADLIANTATVTTPTYTTATSTWPDPVIKGNNGGTSRFFSMGERFTGDGATKYDLSEFGYVVGGGVPSFERQKVANDLDHIATRRSLMVNLMDCRTAAPAGMPAYVDVPAFGDHTAANERGMVKAIYLEESTSRAVSTNSSYVISSLQSISLTNTLTLAAPLPKGITLDGLSLEDSNTGAGSPDFKQTISVATARQIPLAWSYETGITDVNAAPDDVTVNLYNVVSSLDRRLVRVFHTASAQIVIDSSVFDISKYPTRNFIVEVISRVGAPDAKTGDYTKLNYPMASASVFPYAFHVAP